jgi:hypothetical protein
MRTRQSQPRRWQFGMPICILAGVLLVWLCLGIYLVFNWPFSEKKVTEDLEHFSSARVNIAKFHKSFLRHPGYVAEGFTFWRRSGTREVQIASVDKIVCEGNWLSILLFRHYVGLLKLDGVHVVILHPMPPPIPLFPGLKERTTVARLVADGAVLDITPQTPRSKPLKFVFEKLRLGNIKKQNSIAIETVTKIPMPTGRVHVRGTFGPFIADHTGETKVAASYSVENLDLQQTNAVGGILSGRGSFRGKLADCRVGGIVTVNNFEVETVKHNVKLTADFDTTLNALKGEVTAHSVHAHFEKTEIDGSGTIFSTPDRKGKETSFLLTSKGAEIQDLLWLFTRPDVPAMRGPITFKVQTVLPPGTLPFLRRIQMRGEFDLSQAEFLHADTDLSLRKMSERAQGKNWKTINLDAHPVLSSFDAQVVTADGTATLSHAEFKTPGATARGSGTFNLLDERLNFRGKIALQASLSRAAGGLKSVFLLPLDPFYKKGNAGAELPVRITGTYQHPQFHVSLTGNQ